MTLILKIVREASLLSISCFQSGQFFRHLSLYCRMIDDNKISIMAKLNQFIGIDISKSNFDVAFLANGTIRTQKYDYTQGGIQLFMKTLSFHSHCVMESTGVYHLKLAYILYEKKYKVSVVNPLKIKKFIQAQLRRTKTDKQDAIHIQQYVSIMPF